MILNRIFRWAAIIMVGECMLAANLSGQDEDNRSIGGREASFEWPEGKRAAISLTFDDARLSQPDYGIPLLDKYGIKATFYVTPGNIEKRLDGWKRAVSGGHEIGNHTLNHPCSGIFEFAKNKALEDYTYEKIKAEVDDANAMIERLLGVRPVTFAYPCGNTSIGRGDALKSFVPLIAGQFIAGRGYPYTAANDPEYCDFPHLMSVDCDGLNYEQMKRFVEQAVLQGRWLIFTGHEMSASGYQTTQVPDLERLCRYLTDPENGLWVGTVKEIVEYIRTNQTAEARAATPLYLDSRQPVEKRVEDLLNRMTLEEKIGQLNWPRAQEMGVDFQSQLEGCRKYSEGTKYTNIGPAGGFFILTYLLKEGPRQHAEILNEMQKIACEKSRLKIPLMQVEEGVHGLRATGGTIFPEGLAIGSTWDMDLVNRIYTAAAKEARSIGIHQLCTLVIEPNRDPRLGRNEEGYSEDPYLCSRIAEAIVNGAQGEDLSSDDKVVAILCHFPGQSQPVSGMERGAMEISERTLREVFLPPWRAGITEAGALGVMATYPAIDGVPSHSSYEIQTKILRDELRFKGCVVSEGAGIGTLIYEHIAADQKEAGELNIKAGVDISIWNEDGYLGPMIDNIREGKVSIETIDRSVRRALRLKFMLGLFEKPYVSVDRAVETVNCEEHRELALKVAREGIVLLKNENNILPLDKNVRTIAVIGPNADDERNQMGDYSIDVITQDLVTILDGIKSKVSPQTEVVYVKGCDVIGDKVNEIDAARSAAERADVAIVVVGESQSTNGEGHDVASLDLTGRQEEIIKKVHETGTPTVVVLVNGRPLSIRWTAEHVPAIVEAWNCGERGGHAVADVLFGDVNPSGRLPITIPRHVGQLPAYYNYMPSKAFRMNRRSYVDMEGTPLFEFGFGLSYTQFEYSNLTTSPAKTGPACEIFVTADVKNTGGRAGAEVVQLYVNDTLATVSTPVKELQGFKKIFLEPGQKKTVTFKLAPDNLALYNRNMEWVVEPGTFEVMVGSSSADIRLKGRFEVVE